MEKVAKSFNLMWEGTELPKCESKNGQHSWVCIRSPLGNRSGWHVDKCEVCGIETEYDTSD